jgi:hypothetical protein
MEEGKLKKTVIAVLTLGLVIPNIACANDCRYWRKQISKVQGWKTDNASQRQANERQVRYLESQLDKCQGTTSGPISVINGQPSNNNYAGNALYISSSIQDPELQQLIDTCNRWVRVYNNSPSADNLSIKDTACRAATNKEIQLKSPSQAPALKIKRSAKDCMKPNNVIDDDVKACMQGVKEPTWSTAKSEG